MENMNSKLSEMELNEVVGGNKYYDDTTYRRHKITVLDGGRTCFYTPNGPTGASHEVSEGEAAAIVYYRTQFPPSDVEKLYKQGWDWFLSKVTAYRDSNQTDFAAHYMKRSKA